FQEESAAFDDVAAHILALHRSDLACMTMLLFGGAASVDQLTAALHVQRGAVTATVERLQLAGYARRRPEIGGARIELTVFDTRSDGHEHVHGPGGGGAEAPDPKAEKVAGASAVTCKGGTSSRRPIASRTAAVQLFVEANLERTIHLADLAGRAELSLHHFARAFKMSAGMTPRAFVEERRIERAKQL